jgi:uroporphyrinogen-III synthase
MKKIYLLSPTKIENNRIIHSPTIKIKFLKKKLPNLDFDTLIFTSKNGVRALNNIFPNWIKIPTIAIGKGTKDIILNYNGIVLDTPINSYGEDLANLILEKYSDKRFLYVRPKKIISAMPKILKTQNIIFNEIILYETICNKIEHIQENSIIIATSPSTIECLLKNQNPPKNTIFIAIGKKTLKIIPKNYISYLSPKQTIESSIEFSNKFW